MSNSSGRRRFVLLALAILLLLLSLLLVRCSCAKTQAPLPAPPPTSSVVQAPAPADATPPTAEVLTPATVQAPPQVAAGAAFVVTWKGPNNTGDHLTIVRPNEPASVYGNYRETRDGSPLELTAPMELGTWEVRYVTARSRSVLGRAAITVAPTAAALTAAAEVIAGSPLTVTWTGPNNAGDYITLVPASARDAEHGPSTYTEKGSPVTVTAPVETGNAELRYITGQGAKVLARRPIAIVAADVALSAPSEVIAGAAIIVTWTGPNNAGDYITIVPKAARDGEHGNSTYTNKGSPLSVMSLIESGDAELRYMTAQSTRVLARRAIKIIPAEVTLSAPGDAIAGTNVAVKWTGPNNPGDYLTLVSQTARDGQYGNSSYTTKGSPLTVVAPIDPGDVEVRYMSGQGAKVLARRPIKISAAPVTMSAPEAVVTGSPVSITWTGPNNPGDYVTIVAKTARDGEYGASTYTTSGSPLNVLAPKTAGDAEVRYMSGQGARVLMRRPITITAGK